MNDLLDIALTFPTGMNDEDTKALLAVLKENFEIVDDGRSNFSPDWTTVIALLKEGSQLVGGLSALASLANTLIGWRAKTAKSGRSTFVRVKMTGRREIDLQSMSDAEIRLIIEDHRD